MSRSQNGNDAAEERLYQAAEQYFTRVNNYREFSFEGLANSLGLDKRSHLLILPWQQWMDMKDDWMRRRLRQVMDNVYQESTIQDDFGVERIAQMGGVHRLTFYRLMKEEWQVRRATLPTYRERVLDTIKAMVDANVPLSAFTKKNVLAAAGIAKRDKRNWPSEFWQTSYLELVHRQSTEAPPPESVVNMCLVAGTWVDLESDQWDLRSADKGVILRRNSLRDDFAEIAWPCLREELRSGDAAVSTVIAHHQGFVWAGILLGDKIPDIRRASLDLIQGAWVRCEGSRTKRERIRQGLRRVFDALVDLAAKDATIDRDQMIRIANWLLTSTKIPRDRPRRTFLSQKEVVDIVSKCLDEVYSGIALTENEPNLLSMSTRFSVADSGVATAVVRWATALVVLLMAFTGLRCQSIWYLQVDDWVEVRPGLFTLAWRHSKKGEEHLAVLPAELAQILDIYVRRTAAVRAALQTQQVFLTGNLVGFWEALTRGTLNTRLREFSERHQLMREDAPLLLGSTIFRRTYVTRALHEGQSAWSLRHQLGHVHISSTFIYGQFDRFEHPHHVRAPLDTYGRLTLALWMEPRLLNELASEERSLLLGVKTERQQDVGLCAYDRCIKAEKGSPPPCSLCEHLVTGPEFLDAWEAERIRREQALLQMGAIPGSELTIAQMKAQLAHFQAIYEWLKKRCGV